MHINNSGPNQSHHRKTTTKIMTYNNSATNRYYNFGENRPPNRNHRNDLRLNQSKHLTNKYQWQNNRYNTEIHNNHKYINLKNTDIRKNIEESHLNNRFLKRKQNYIDTGWPTKTEINQPFIKKIINTHRNRHRM